MLIVVFPEVLEGFPRQDGVQFFVVRAAPTYIQFSYKKLSRKEWDVQTLRVGKDKEE